MISSLFYKNMLYTAYINYVIFLYYNEMFSPIRRSDYYKTSDYQGFTASRLLIILLTKHSLYSTSVLLKLQNERKLNILCI